MNKCKQLTKKQKKLINSLKITKELLILVIHSFNQNAKKLKITSEERNSDTLNNNTLLEQKCYEAKSFLLNLFFKAKEIHILNSGVELLYYPTSPYTGFHVPNNGTNNNLKKIRINREKTPNLQTTPILEMEFCLRVFKLGNKLKLI